MGKPRSPVKNKPTASGGKRALIVGINSPQRKGAVNDCKAVAEFLSGQGFSTHMLTGKAATETNIMAALDAALKSGDHVVMHWSGPGCEAPAGADPTAICPADFIWDGPETPDLTRKRK